ncbi:MAG: cold shock domain-containing protein, partial [Gaiellaceae bacterium]
RTESKVNGTVKTLTDRGYGFIAQADGTDLFFHRSQVEGGGFDRLVVGQAVTYEKGMSSRNNKEEAQKVTPA